VQPVVRVPLVARRKSSGGTRKSFGIISFLSHFNFKDFNSITEITDVYLNGKESIYDVIFIVAPCVLKIH
jgi:hypothetical protein